MTVTALPEKELLRPDEVAKQKVMIMNDLPEKKLLRVSEAANYFGVHERTVRLWIEHGKLTAEKLAGSVRIPRESIINFRLTGNNKIIKNNA